MQLRWAWAVVLSAGLGAWAQAPAPPPNAAEALFAQARAAARQLPPNAEPIYLSLIAQNEAMSQQPAAGDDAEAAFRQALALPADARQDRDAVLGPALLAMSLAKQADRAMALVHQTTPPAGLTKAELYDKVALFEAKGMTVEQVQAIVDECQQSDGSFPFSTVSLAATMKKSSAPEAWSGLVGQGYAAVERVHDMTTALLASSFLGIGHRLAPARDAQLADALTALMQKLGTLASTPQEKQQGAMLGHSAMVLLGKVDPARADELKASLPAFATPPPSIPSIGGITVAPDANGKMDIHFPKYMSILFSAADAANPEEPVQAAAALPAPQDRFRALEGVAGVLAKDHPKQAQEAADAAAAMIGSSISLKEDPPPPASGSNLAANAAAMLGSNLETASELAGIQAKLGETDAAHDLAGRCLAAADQQAATLDAEYTVDALRQPGKPEELPGRMFTLGAIYTSLAKVDFTEAASHAANLRSPAVRVMVLASLAGGWKAEGAAK